MLVLWSTINSFRTLLHRLSIWGGGGGKYTVGGIYTVRTSNESNQSRGNEITNARHHQAQIKKWRGNVDFCHFLNNNIFKLFLIFEFCFHKTSMNIVVSTQSQQQVKSTQHTQHTCTKDRKILERLATIPLEKKQKQIQLYLRCATIYTAAWNDNDTNNERQC